MHRRTFVLPCLQLSFCIPTKACSWPNKNLPACLPAWPKRRATCLQLQFRPGRVLILGFRLSSEGIIQGFLWHRTLWPARNWDGNNLLLSYTPPPKEAMLRFHTRPLLVPRLKIRKIWVREGRELTIRHARFDSQSSICLKKCASNLSRIQRPLRSTTVVWQESFTYAEKGSGCGVILKVLGYGLCLLNCLLLP